MPYSPAQSLLISWRRNTAYALRLVGDLTEIDQMIAQPVPGVTMNHPSWIFSHLSVYAPIVTALLRGQAFEDPADHRYGGKSKCINSASEYPPREQLIRDYTSLHTAAESAFEQAPPDIFERPTPLERWRTMHPRVGDMLVTLAVKHESTHLGQLSAWRRAMKLLPVQV